MEYIIQQESKEQRNGNIYRLVTEGQSPRAVGDLYSMTESYIRRIYYKEMVRRSELYEYFKNVPVDIKAARHLTRLMNKQGISTVADFQSKSVKWLLDSTVGVQSHIMEALIKARSPENYRLYEFIKQSRNQYFFKRKFYFILIDAGVETLDDFCTFKLHTLYYAKWTGDSTIATLRGLQAKAKTLTR